MWCGNSTGEAPKDFELEWSDDGTTWNSVLSVTNETGWGSDPRFFDV